MWESLLETYTGEIWAESWGDEGASHKKRHEQSVSGRRNKGCKSPEIAAIVQGKILVSLIWFLESRIVPIWFLHARLDLDNIKAYIIDGKAREQGSKNRQELRKANWTQETQSRQNSWLVRTPVCRHHRYQTPDITITEDNLSLPLHLCIIPSRFRVAESRSWDAHIPAAWKW